MNNLTELIKQWATDRNLHTADPAKQMLKLIEEFGEICSGLARNNVAEIKDGIGDTKVVLTILESQLGNNSFAEMEPRNIEVLTFLMEIGDVAYDVLNVDAETAISGLYAANNTLDRLALSVDTTIEECTQLAYNEIKNRKGKLVGGIYVKDSDIKK